MTLEALAERVGLHHSHLSRIEKGERPLSMDQAEAIARELNDTAANVMGLEQPGDIPLTGMTAGGLAEDFAPYVEDDGWNLPALRGHEYRYSVGSNVLAKLGILKGDVVYVDQDSKLCANPTALQPVRVHWFEPDGDSTPVWLMRQFVPPSLLITNAADGENLRSIDMDSEDVKIVGIITSVHRRFRAI